MGEMEVEERKKESRKKSIESRGGGMVKKMVENVYSKRG